MAEVFSEFLGTDDIDLDIRGFGAAGAPGNLDAVRHFDTTDQLRTEVINARLWGGIHYRFSTEAGVHLGCMVAHYGLNHAFKPSANSRERGAALSAAPRSSSPEAIHSPREAH